MREIKFRAWNKFKCEMFNPMPIIDFKIYEINAVDLLQFTGLKDKNGKEIYEGDIISSKPYLPQNNEERIISQIVFREDLARWNAEGVGKWEGEYDHLHEANQPPHETEVIGNIFENPELLKELTVSNTQEE